MKNSLIILICLVLLPNLAKGQCACMNGATVSGISPLMGTANIGLLKSDYLRVLAYYTNTYGNTYYSGANKTASGLVKEFRNSNLILNAGYGLTDNLTAEAEIGYSIDKTQKLETYSVSATGLSYLNLMLKYNLLKFSVKQIEWTAGAGIRIPFPTDENKPVHLNPSTGAYGIALQSFLHKGFKASGTHFILSNRFEYNFEGENKYRYGIAAINSLFFVQNISDNVNGILELRSDYRAKDETKGAIIANSGSNSIVISPQLNYNFSDFGISAMFDFPVYKYYNGSQLTNSYSFGLALNWNYLID